MKHRIVRRIRRPTVDAVRALASHGVATIHEAQGRTGLLKPYMRPIYSAARVCGPAITVSCHPGDNLMIHAAIEVCAPGDVLVVAPTAESTDGMFGELLANSCVAHGVVGLIVEAGVRDVADLTTMNFPVWSKAISAQGTVKASAGSVNTEIVCAGVTVRPGDVVIGDQDGVVIVKREQAAEIAKLSDARVAREKLTRERLRAGELGVDFYGLREKLLTLGVEYVDEEDQDG
jgi:4-hydroxy-4-methyl-2-oxoglutarate aldolase